MSLSADYNMWLMTLSSIPEILDDLSDGKLIILVDDESRENEGDFVCAAEKIDIGLINFMTRIGGGYLCVALDQASCERLHLTPQVLTNDSLRGTPLTVSVDGHPRHGVGTGISAADRVATIKLLIDPDSQPDDFVRPGHINPLKARKGGVLVRTGQTEGSVDLCTLAGLKPGAAIIEIVRPDGEMARIPDLEILCREHNIKMCSVEQIIEYRLARESLVERMSPQEGVQVDTPEGQFTLVAFRSVIDPLPHLAFCVGDVGKLSPTGHIIPSQEPVLVRMHRRDLLGDVFNEGHNPTAETLHASMRALQEAGHGALIYLRPELAGDGLRQRILQISRPHHDDVNAPDLTRSDSIASRVQPMENREFGIGGQILRELGLTKLRILTNTPKHMTGLGAFGLEIVEHVEVHASESSKASTV